MEGSAVTVWVVIEVLRHSTELCGSLGDDGLRKVAYRGG